MTKIPLESIRFSRFQPRKNLPEAAIQELANSIRESGLIYPLLVRNTTQSGVDNPQYELIAGERRFRALRLLGEQQAPVIVKDTTDRQALELALIENLQREELNAMEQAEAYQRLSAEFSLTQEQIAQAVGKDRATIANTLRLTKLTPRVQDLLRAGRLSLGHARTLLAIESAKSQLALAERVAAQGLSVRQVELIVRGLLEGPARGKPGKSKDPHVASVEQKLQRSLGTQVQISHGKKRGWIRIAYFSLKDLDRLIARLT